MARMSEDALCAALADELVASDAFRHWLLRQTCFAPLAGKARLLHAEQAALRPRRFWWRHWWCAVPALAHQRETDIFCVFEAENERFALHIENKLGRGRFLSGQAEGYKPRAAFMANQPRFMNYSAWTTMLLAPAAFLAHFSSDCTAFDVVLSHESISAFIPEFAGR